MVSTSPGIFYPAFSSLFLCLSGHSPRRMAKPTSSPGEFSIEFRHDACPLTKEIFTQRGLPLASRPVVTSGMKFAAQHGAFLSNSEARATNHESGITSFVTNYESPITNHGPFNSQLIVTPESRTPSKQREKPHPNGYKNAFFQAPFSDCPSRSPSSLNFSLWHSDRFIGMHSAERV